VSERRAEDTCLVEGNQKKALGVAAEGTAVFGDGATEGEGGAVLAGAVKVAPVFIAAGAGIRV
jgi:hypothetical protein